MDVKGSGGVAASTARKVDAVEMSTASDTAPHVKTAEHEETRAEFVHRVDAVCDVFEFGSGTD